MKKPIKPLTHPINLQITPRLLAAVEASAGRKVPPGARIMLVPPIQTPNGTPTPKITAPVIISSPT